MIQSIQDAGPAGISTREINEKIKAQFHNTPANHVVAINGELKDKQKFADRVRWDTKAKKWFPAQAA